MTSNLFLISSQNLWFTVDLKIGEWSSGLKWKVLSLIFLNSVLQDEGKKLVFWNMAYAATWSDELSKIRYGFVLPMLLFIFHNFSPFNDRSHLK